MKHIKTYEKVVSKYKEGDYILYNEGCYMKSIINSYKCYVLIKEVVIRLTQTPMYLIYYYDLDIKKYKILESNFLLENKIIRKLIAKEIEEFKLIDIMNRYNI
jgi:hypothetical protein